MQKTPKRIFIFLILLSSILLTSCVSTEAIPIENLNQVVILSEFGFMMNYPDGWELETHPPLIILSENLENQETPTDAPGLTNVGYRIIFDYLDISSMRAMGLKRNASLQDLLKFNKIYFAWLEPMEVVETEIFEVESLRVKKQIDDEWSIHFIGIRNDAVFLFGVIAPSEGALDEFVPTWDAMIKSILPVSG